MESRRWNKSFEDLSLEIQSKPPLPLPPGIRAGFFRPMSDNASNEEKGFRNAQFTLFFV